MQVEVDMKRMQTNFGEHGLSGLGDFAPFLFAFKTVKTSLSMCNCKYQNFLKAKVRKLINYYKNRSTTKNIKIQKNC